MVGNATALGQDLGMTRVVDPAGMEGFLVERECRDRIDFPEQGEVDGRHEEVMGRPAGAGVDTPGGDVREVVT